MTVATTDRYDLPKVQSHLKQRLYFDKLALFSDKVRSYDTSVFVT